MRTFDLTLQAGKYNIEIDSQNCCGFFEHTTQGEGSCGSLDFMYIGTDSPLTTLKWARFELVDFDGVYSLPAQVVKVLRDVGFIVGNHFD